MLFLRWGIVLGAFAPLFAVWPGAASPYVLPKLMALSLAAAVLSFAALRSPSNSARPAAAPAPDILRPLAVCIGVLFLACLFSRAGAVSLLGEYSQRSSGFICLVLCAVVAAIARSAGTVHARHALFWGAVAGAALSLVGLLQLAGLDPVLNAIGGLAYGRIGSWVGSPIGLGCGLAMILPLQLRLALDGEGLGERRTGWACLLLGGLGLLFTWSRGAWLAGAIASGCYLFWTGRVRGPRTRLAAVKATAAAVFAAAALALIAGRVRPVAASDLGRLAVWESAWRMFAAHPILGVGPDAFSLMLGRYKTEAFVRIYGESTGQAHAHNDFLQVLSTVGLAGFGAYVWLLVAAWRRLRNALRDEELRVDSAAAGAGLMAVFIVAKFNPIYIDALALGAVLLGLIDPRGPRPRGLPTAALTLSLPGILVSTWLLVADWQCMKGMRAQHEGRLGEARAAYAAAAALNPTASQYGFWLSGLLRQQARTEKDPGRRRVLGLDAVEAARAMEKWNPADFLALHALGGSLAALTLQGGPNGLVEAAGVLDRGVRANWSYRPLIETRMAVATLRGDRRVAEDCTARLARLDALRRAATP